MEENAIKKIAEKIKKNGGNLYLVGGALRDELLGRKAKDRDYCVTGITGEKFLELFPDAHIRGKSFEVYDIDGIEFAMARTEKKMGKGHQEFKIQTGATIEEDLKRRDITINSIAKEVLTDKIIDPFGGKEDLKNRTIRHTSTEFIEDPLRVYRVARFSAILEFKVEKNTINLMKEMQEELANLSQERVFDELKKALASKRPSIFFEVLKDAEILAVHFKEINDLIGVEQPVKYHPEGDCFNHTMQVLDICSNITQKYMQTQEKSIAEKQLKDKVLAIRFSSLVHDLGKGTTKKSILPHHYGHEERGVELVENLGKRLKMPKLWIKCGKVATKEHMRGGIFYQMSIPKQVDFITRIDKSILGLKGLEIIVVADRMGRKKELKIEQQVEIPSDIAFADMAKKCITEVNGKLVKEKYKIEEDSQIAEKIRIERINYLKQNQEERERK